LDHFSIRSLPIMTEYLLLKFDDKDTDELERRVEGHIRYFTDMVKI